MGADYDVCTTFAKFGRCDRADCRWTHDNAEWRDGAWWQLDDLGRPWGWWTSLPASEECPVTLTPICQLPDPPFELLPDDAKRPDWKTATDGPIHRFDGSALAKYLVGSGQFMNPVNRRPLQRGECVALDKATKNVFGVAEAFGAVQSAQKAGGGRSAATREMAVAARQLFVLPSAAASAGAAEQGASGAAAPGANASSAPGQPGRWNRRGGGGSSASGAQVPVGPRDALTVHSEGGLRVVDETMPEGYPTAGSYVPLGGDHGLAEPTPAEALAAEVAPSRPRLAPRPLRQGGPQVGRQDAARQQQLRDAGDCGGGEGGAQAACSSRPQRREQQSSASGSGGSRQRAAPPVEEAGFKPRVLVIDEAEEQHDTGQAWVPPWATLELQARQLQEVTQLLQAGRMRLLSGGAAALSALQASCMRGELLAGGCAFECEAPVSDEVDVCLSVPSFYPSQPVVVTRVQGASAASSSSSGPGLAQAVARGLEREVRQRVALLRDQEDPSLLTALIDWLASEGPVRLEALKTEAKAPCRAGRQQGDGGRRAQPPPEPIERAADPEKVERNAEKYSSGWDLCTAFVKHGKCKNKSCKWRHEKPVAKPVEQPPAVEATAEKPLREKAKGGKAKK